MRNKKIWLSILSELFVSLAAFWFGAAVLAPFSDDPFLAKVLLLTINASVGIVSLFIAYYFRKVGKSKK